METKQASPQEKEQTENYRLVVEGKARVLNLQVKVLDKITTGGTKPIDVVEAKFKSDNRNKDLGKYIVKREFYPGEAEVQLELYHRCQEIGLPVPPTFRKAELETEEAALLVTYLKPEGGEVWSLNDAKEKPLPDFDPDRSRVEEQLKSIANLATAHGIELNSYAFLVMIDEEGNAEVLIGDFGDTEMIIHDQDQSHQYIQDRNKGAVKDFLKRSGIVESPDREQKKISISV